MKLLLVRAALVFVATASVWSSASFYRSRRAVNAATRDSYAVAYLDALLGKAANDIPSSAVVGYVSDVPLSDPRAGAEFFAVQYALAPRLLVEDDGAPEWIVGSFAGSAGLGEYARQRGWRLVREVDRGLVLFRRRSR